MVSGGRAFIHTVTHHQGTARAQQKLSAEASRPKFYRAAI